jgi:hypothetical protein
MLVLLDHFLALQLHLEGALPQLQMARKPSSPRIVCSAAWTIPRRSRPMRPQSNWSSASLTRRRGSMLDSRSVSCCSFFRRVSRSFWKAVRLSSEADS